jgi:hypothetical protein
MRLRLMLEADLSEDAKSEEQLQTAVDQTSIEDVTRRPWQKPIVLGGALLASAEAIFTNPGEGGTNAC